MPSYPAIKAII